MSPTRKKLGALDFIYVSVYAQTMPSPIGQQSLNILNVNSKNCRRRRRLATPNLKIASI